METEYNQLQKGVRNAKISVIANTAGFLVGLSITYATIASPSSSVYLITWGAIIFCPIYALKSLWKYRKLKKLLL